MSKEMAQRVNYAIMRAFFDREPNESGERIFTASPSDNEDLAQAAIDAIQPLTVSEIIKMSDPNCLVGVVMMLTGGSANPEVVKSILQRVLSEMPK